MARPRIELDISRVEELAAQGLTQAEICLCLGISENTLLRRKNESEVVADAIKSGKAKAASEIANVLYRMACSGDLGAIVWWEKTRRGLTDRVQQEHSGVLRIEYVNDADN
jgi:transcriptional regulator with XRE-family HTH domain